MKGKWVVVCIAALALGVGIDGAMAAVELPFYDAFEGYQVGMESPGPWQTLFDGVSATVSDDWARSGDRSLRVEGRPYWARMEYVKLASLTDLLSYGATVYLQSGTPDVKIGFMFRHPTQPLGYVENSFRFYPDGTLTWLAKDTQVEICNFGVGDILRLRADIDASTESADVYVFNLNTGDWYYKLDVPAWPHRMHAYWGSDVVLDQFGVSAGGHEGPLNTVVYVDDVLVIPEPAALALLTLGGVALLRRRKNGPGKP